jgi:hypothetical protein
VKVLKINDGLAGRVGELLKTWDEVSPTKVHKFSKEARNIIAFMDEQRVNDDDLEGLIDIAMLLTFQIPKYVILNIFKVHHELGMGFGI